MIEGIVYDLQNITASDMALVYWMYGGMRDGIITGCSMSYTSSAVAITSGYFSARGHLTKLSGTTSVSLPTVSGSTLYCNLVYQIDLSQTASQSSFTQGSFIVLTNSTTYPTPTQQDLDNGGTIYQMSFAKFKLGTSGVSGWKKNTATYNEWIRNVEVPVSGWSSTYPYTQSITLATTTASAQPIWDIDGWGTMVTQADAADYKDSFNAIDHIETTATGINLYCYVDRPSMTVYIKLKGI